MLNLSLCYSHYQWSCRCEWWRVVKQKVKCWS